MQHAAVAMCPVFGGKLVSYDASIALSRPGVRRVLQIDEGGTVAVVADEWW
jgi:isoquinoline 1-oxidoreductase beta subunit